MKFFNNAPAASAEADAAGARLSAIVERGQAELSYYGTGPEPAKHDGIQRRFWTPDELEAEKEGE